MIDYRNEQYAWTPRLNFYPGVGPEQTAGYINAEGEHPPGWQDPDAAEKKAKKTCDDLYPVAAKNDGRIGESKKWKTCKKDAATKAEEIRAANAKLEAEYASEESFSRSVRSLTEPTVSADGAGADYTNVIIGVLAIAVLAGGAWFIYRQFFSSPAVAEAK